MMMNMMTMTITVTIMTITVTIMTILIGNHTKAATANGKVTLMMIQMSGLAKMMNRTMNGIHGGITASFMVMTGSVPMI